MRFMVITKADADSEAGVLPSTEDFDTMGRFIGELVDAGVLLAAEGLQSSAHGARIYFDGARSAASLSARFSTPRTVASTASFWPTPARKPGMEPPGSTMKR